MDKFCKIVETKTHQVLLTYEYDDDMNSEVCKFTTIIEGIRMSVAVPCDEQKLDDFNEKFAEIIVEGMIDEYKTSLGESL